MVKKIILTLTIFITILVLISPINLAADDEIINVPQSATDPEQSQQQMSANGFAAIGSLILGTINKMLSSLATGGQNLSDNTEIGEYFTIQNLLTNQYPIFNINMFEVTPWRTIVRFIK